MAVVVVLGVAVALPAMDPAPPVVEASSHCPSNQTGLTVTTSGTDCELTFKNGWTLSTAAPVPAGVAQITFVAAASGGGGRTGDGKGGRVTGTLDLSSVSSPALYIGVGSYRKAADIRLDGTALGDRVVVAGAGGSCGTDNDGTCGSDGHGGDGGGTQTGGSPSRIVGGENGSNGYSPASNEGGRRGGGGGSTGGFGGGGGTSTYQCTAVANASAGSSGSGGNGSPVPAHGCGNGGSGGDGYFGGGGGSGNSVSSSSHQPGGGGGGGSSYTSSTYVPADGLVYSRGQNSSTGTVVLTYTPRTSAVSQEPIGGTVGVALGTQPTVTLAEGGSAPGSPVTVTASIHSSPSPTGTQITAVLDGTLTADTDGSGEATFTDLSIRGPAGVYELTFTADGYPDVTSATFTLTAGAASALAVSTQPTGGTSGGTVTGSPAVTIIDVGGNPITDSTTSITASSSTGTIGGTVTSTAASGVATFNALTLAGTAGNHTLTFSADGLTPATSDPFAITHGAAAALAVTTEPVGAVAIGSALSVQPEIRVVDAEGNTVTSHPATTVTASVASGDAAITLTNATATTSSGEATFTGLTVNGAGGDVSLTFSAGGLTPVTSEVFSINRTAQTITFSHSGTPTYGDDPFAISASATSGLPVSFTSSTPTVCDVSGTTVAILAAGACTINADQAGDGTYAPAAQQSVTISVAKAAQAALTFTSADTVTFGDALLLAAAGGSGSGALSYAMSGGAGTAGCTIASFGIASVSSSAITSLTHSSPGTCDVTVTKAGDDNHLPETSSPLTITVTKAPQTLTFTSTVPASPQPGGTYAVTAVSDRGLAPTLAITTGSPSVCTLSSGTVSFLTTGSCVVTATQAGDGNYLAAQAIAQTIAVGALNQSITFTQPDDINFGDPDAQLVLSASSGLPVAVESGTTSVCTVSGAAVSVVAVGRCELTASQAGDSRYVEASAVTRSFDIFPALATAPTISSVSAGSGEITVSFAEPGFDGGVSIDAYELVATPTGGGDVVTDSFCPSGPCTIGNLVNGTEYTVTVAAVNAAGTGPASVSSPALTPFTNAQAVRALTGVPGDESLAVSWMEITDGALGGGTFTSYQVTLSDGSTTVVETIADRQTTDHTFTGLSNGTDYTVEVVTLTSANSSAVTGNTATVTVVPATTPAAPRNATAVLSSPLVAVVSWSEPLADGGAPVTSYTVEVVDQTQGSSIDGLETTCSNPTINTTTRVGSCTVTGLSIGSTYEVTITPVNRIGDGASASVTFATAGYTAPLAPDDPGEEDVCTGCITDSDGEEVPTTGTSTPAGESPGVLELGDGITTISVTGATGTVSYVDSDGNLVVEAPGAITVAGSGLLPTSSVTVYWSTDLADTVTITSTGLLSSDIDIPPDASEGVVTIRVDTVGSTGQQRLFRFPVRVIVESETDGESGSGGTGGSGDMSGDGGSGSTGDTSGGADGTGGSGDDQLPPPLPAGGGWPAGPEDPESPCAGCVSVFPAPAPGDEEPDVGLPDVPSSGKPVVITLPSAGGVPTTVSIGGAASDGSPPMAFGGDGTATVTAGSAVPVRLDGLEPGSTVKVWLGDVLLGTATVAADGTVSFDVVVSSDQLGAGTLRIDMVRADGSPASVLFGLVVAAAGSLPVTGRDDLAVAWAMLIAALGALAVLTGRSRRELV